MFPSFFHSYAKDEPLDDRSYSCTCSIMVELCEKQLGYFSSLLEKNELKPKMLVLVVDMVFEDI